MLGSALFPFIVPLIALCHSASRKSVGLGFFLGSGVRPLYLVRLGVELRREAMDSKRDLEQLRTLAQDTQSSGHGSRIRRALLTLAVPAAAALCTACYGVPMTQSHAAETPSFGPAMYLDGSDCDGDGIPESPDPEACSGSSLQLHYPVPLPG